MQVAFILDFFPQDIFLHTKSTCFFLRKKVQNKKKYKFPIKSIILAFKLIFSTWQNCSPQTQGSASVTNIRYDLRHTKLSPQTPLQCEHVYNFGHSFFYDKIGENCVRYLKIPISVWEWVAKRQSLEHKSHQFKRSWHSF